MAGPLCSGNFRRLSVWFFFGKDDKTTDNLFMLRCILEKFYELNLDLHLLFIDFKQEYDSVNGIYL